MLIRGKECLRLNRSYCDLDIAKDIYQRVFPKYISDFSDSVNVESGFSKFVKSRRRYVPYDVLFELVRDVFPNWCKEHRKILKKLQRILRERLRILRGKKRCIKREHTKAEWQLKLIEFGNRCVYCGTMDKPMTKDHIIPVSNGGSDKIENIVPACKSCNSRKHNKSLKQFLSEKNCPAPVV